MQLRPGEEQDRAGRGQHDEFVAGLMVQRPRPGLPFPGHLGRRGQPAGVVLVVVEPVRAVRDRAIEAWQIEGHGVVVPYREDRQPPVDLLGGSAVPDVAVPRKSEGDAGRQMARGKGGTGLRHVVVRGFGGQPRLANDFADEFLGKIRVDESGFPYTQRLRHFLRAEVLVGVFGIVRPEQLGELLAGMLDEIADGTKARQDDEISVVNGLPQLFRGTRPDRRRRSYLLPLFL